MYALLLYYCLYGYVNINIFAGAYVPASFVSSSSTAACSVGYSAAAAEPHIPKIKYKQYITYSRQGSLTQKIIDGDGGRLASVEDTTRPLLPRRAAAVEVVHYGAKDVLLLPLDD